MVILLPVCSVFFIITGITSAQTPCRTPDGWNGNCIVVQQCRPLYNILAIQQLSTEQRNFLRKSQCGHDGTNPLVCCPNTFTINDLPSNRTCGRLTTDRLIGGTELFLTEFPWNVLLHYKNVSTNVRRDSFFCGGTLIHENYVITAAQCINGVEVARKGYILDSVRLGEHDLRTDPDCQFDECADSVVDIPIAETILHENYVATSSSQANDIALIRLQRTAPYTDFIQPICLPVMEGLRNKNYDGRSMNVVGFGKTINASQSDVKMRSYVEGLNSDRCSTIFMRNASPIDLSYKQLCAGDGEDSGNCNADSGGPLLELFFDVAPNKAPFYILVGIASFGPAQCGTPGFPVVYTRVDQYIDWILDHMKKNISEHA